MVTAIGGSPRAAVALAALILADGAIGAAPAGNLPPAWPRAGSTTLVENARGAAYNVTYRVNQPSILHQHRHPFAGVDLATSSVKVVDSDGTMHIFPVVKNAMWFLPKGVPHREMSITDPPRHIIAIDIKEKSVPETTNPTLLPANLFAAGQKKVLDNDQAIIWDCAWASGALGQASFATRDIFVAFAEGGDFRVEESGAPATVHHYETGQAIFLPAGHVRTLSAARGTIHAMIVQVR